ncbi:MAG: hypothetical protein AAGA55_03940 [Planctomycetota bacterium]
MRMTFGNFCCAAGVIQVVLAPLVTASLYIGSTYVRSPDSFIEAHDLQGELWRAGVRFEDEEAGEKVLYELVRSRYEFNGIDVLVWSAVFIANGLVSIKLSRSFAPSPTMACCDAN